MEADLPNPRAGILFPSLRVMRGADMVARGDRHRALVEDESPHRYDHSWSRVYSVDGVHDPVRPVRPKTQGQASGLEHRQKIGKTTRLQ